MQDPPVLGHVALGYSPIVDRQRNVIATRLTVFAGRPDGTPDAAALLQALAPVGPPRDEPLGTITLRSLDLAPVGPRDAAAPAAPAVAAAAATALPPISLNVADEALLRAVLAQQPGSQVMIEVPAFMAGDAALAETLRQLRAGGTPLLVKGRSSVPLPPEVLACFGHAIVEPGEQRRTAARTEPGRPALATLQAGVHSTAQADEAFRLGASAVIGWPFGDPLPAAGGRARQATDVQVVLELIQGVEREDPVPRLEAVLKRDPTLAFKLMRYINSAAFGLRVEINSFGHALMLLGYQRLKRWLALLLANSSRSPNARPIIFAAVRRGLLMEELARDRGDSSMRSEMFICGVFSLLDRLMEQPLPELLRSVPVPDTVQQALSGEGGPYLPYLQLVQAIEQESVYDIRDGAERLLLSALEVNRSVLAALTAALQLDS